MIDAIVALGRRERLADHGALFGPLLRLADRERVLVAGASGRVGVPLVEALERGGVPTLATDEAELDVTIPGLVHDYLVDWRPTLIVNLAAAKDAPVGELEPLPTVLTSVLGAANLASEGAKVGARLIQISTCKAADPETCYGAGKLVAERIALNAGGSVVRFVNTLEAGPNVVDTWRAAVAAGEPLEIMPCSRYFQTTAEAVGLTLWACTAPPGRYKLDAGRPVTMLEMAARLFPDHPRVTVPRRRGDRSVEPPHAIHETVWPTTSPSVLEIRSYHDA